MHRERLAHDGAEHGLVGALADLVSRDLEVAVVVRLVHVLE